MRARIALAALLAAAASACSSPAPPAAPPPELPPPAEPAVAPELTAAPAGRVVPLPALPEGAVADPVTHLVAVGVREPNGLAIVDGRTGELRTRVPLPGHLRHLQLVAPGGPVLVADEDSDELFTIALPSGAVISHVRTGESPHDATAAANGLVFAANEGGRSVAVLRGDQVVHTFGDLTQPAGLAAIGNLVALVDVRQNDLTGYDADTLTQVARVPAGRGPTHVVADKHGRFAVTDTRGDAVILYEATPRLREVARLDLPGSPYGITYDDVHDRLWVTLTARNEVVAVDLGGTAPTVGVRLPTVRQPDTVAVDGVLNTLYVTGTEAGALQLIGG